MVVLATKCYVEGKARDGAIDAMESLVGNDIGTLEVDAGVGVRHDDFVSVTLNGPDKAAARNVLRERWGTVTPHFEDGSVYRGTLESWDADGFTLDAGRDIRVPRTELGLGPGDAGQIRDRFGIVQHLPIRFRYRTDDSHELAEAEQDRLYSWTRGPGRVNVNSTTRAAARATVNRAGHAQDIIGVERLGLLEQSIICDENTDPPGLLAAIGEHLPAELRCVVPG